MKTIKRGLTLAKQQRMILFLNEYLRNGGKGGEAARTALKIEDKVRAQKIACDYLRNIHQLPEITRQVLEAKGLGLSYFIEVALQKMDHSNSPEWWDRLLQMAGYTPVTINDL